MMEKMKAPKMPATRARATKAAKPVMEGMPDFTQRAKRPGGMKKGGAVKAYAGGGCVTGMKGKK